MRTASSWCSRATARRRWWRVPLLPRVSSFSATERAALALASVVVIRLCLIKLHTRLASMALRCSPVRPSLAVRLRCRILLFDEGFRLFFGGFEQLRLDIHAQAQAKRGQLLFDFVEGLLPEIAVLEHFSFRLHRQLADRGDVGVVQTVG